VQSLPQVTPDGTLLTVPLPVVVTVVVTVRRIVAGAR